MRLLPNIRFGTERYPEKVARRLRTLNIGTWIAAASSVFFAALSFVDLTRLWLVPVHAVGTLFFAGVPLLHRLNPWAGPAVDHRPVLLEIIAFASWSAPGPASSSTSARCGAHGDVLRHRAGRRHDRLRGDFGGADHRRAARGPRRHRAAASLANPNSPCGECRPQRRKPSADRLLCVERGRPRRSCRRARVRAVRTAARQHLPRPSPPG